MTVDNTAAALYLSTAFILYVIRYGVVITNTQTTLTLGVREINFSPRLLITIIASVPIYDEVQSSAGIRNIVITYHARFIIMPGHSRAAGVLYNIIILCPVEFAIIKNFNLKFILIRYHTRYIFLYIIPDTVPD